MSDVPGYIYMLMTREFINSGESVVKVGRTGDIHDRIKGYPKGSAILFCCFAHDTVRTEALLLAHMAVGFKKRGDLGREYFEGKLNDMVAFAGHYVSSVIKEYVGIDPKLLKRALDEEKRDAAFVSEEPAFLAGESEEALVGLCPLNVAEEVATVEVNAVDDELVEEEAVAKLPQPVSVDSGISAFVSYNATDLDGKSISSEKLFDRFRTFGLRNGWTTMPHHDKFVKRVVMLYGATTSVNLVGATATTMVRMPSFALGDEEAGPRDIEDDHTLMSRFFVATGRREDFVTSSSLSDISRATKMSITKLKARLTQMGAWYDKNCHVNGVAHGRGFMGVRHIEEALRDS
jgi:hypothetical protein